MTAVIDNDILTKGSCYGLLDELLSPVATASNPFGVLGAARFVVSKKISKKTLRKGIEAAIRNLYDFLSRAVVLEPTQDEQTMAAEFELAAQRAGVGLDAGESQLCAILISRLVPLLLTGDKRAVQAIEQLLDSESRLSALCGKTKCLEQLVLDLLAARIDSDMLRGAICEEIEIDKTLTICFSCKSHDGASRNHAEALQSYITDLRKRAPRVLAR